VGSKHKASHSIHLVSPPGSAPTGMEIQKWGEPVTFLYSSISVTSSWLCISCPQSSQTRSKKFSPKNEKDLGMACQIPPLKKQRNKCSFCVQILRGGDPWVQICLASIITVLDCRTHPNFHKIPFTLYGRSNTRQKLDMIIQPVTLLKVFPYPIHTVACWSGMDI